MIKNYGPELVPLNLNTLNFRPVKKGVSYMMSYPEQKPKSLLFLHTVAVERQTGGQDGDRQED